MLSFRCGNSHYENNMVSMTNILSLECYLCTQKDYLKIETGHLIMRYFKRWGNAACYIGKGVGVDRALHINRSSCIRPGFPATSLTTTTTTTKTTTTTTTTTPWQNGRHFTDDIFRCIFVNEKFSILLKFHWSLFLRVRLTITQHWYRYWLGAE